MTITPFTPTESAALYRGCASLEPETQTAASTALWDYLYRVARQITYDQPGADALAQDCAQTALVRIHARLNECREPAAFRVWAKRIVSRLAIDELRRRKRLLPLEKDGILQPVQPSSDETRPPEQITTETISLRELHTLLSHAPISPRSRRVVIGRYLEDKTDEALSQIESEIAGREIRPSHIQVTRSKNMTKLRGWEPLLTYLRGKE